MWRGLRPSLLSKDPLLMTQVALDESLPSLNLSFLHLATFDLSHTHLGGGGNGVVAGLQAGQQLTEVVNGGPQRGVVLKNGQDVPPGFHNPAQVQLLRREDERGWE